MKFALVVFFLPFFSRRKFVNRYIGKKKKKIYHLEGKSLKWISAQRCKVLSFLKSSSSKVVTEEKREEEEREKGRERENEFTERDTRVFIQCSKRDIR